MSTKKISVLAQFVAKVGMEEEVKRELILLLEPTRAEKGCINYDLHQDIENKHIFFLYENWESEELLGEHLKSEHLSKFLEKQEDILSQNISISKAEEIILQD